MNSNLFSILAVAAVILGSTPAVCVRAETASAAASTTDAWQNHLIALLPAGLSPVAVAWDNTNGSTKVQFRLTVQADLPRYERAPFFPMNCTGPVADLRTALVDAGKPVEFLRPSVPAGKELSLSGSFVRRLDGKFSPVVWGPELAQSVGEDCGLPKEDSEYTRQLKAKINETRQAKMAADLNGFVRTIGALSGQVAVVTGNSEAAQVADIAKRISGEHATNSSAVANPAQTNIPAALPADLGKAIQQAGGLVRGIGGLFGK
jgi:hypothetical protein